MYLNNPTIYIIECISWTIKYLKLSMHGATMKIASDVRVINLIAVGRKIVIAIRPADRTGSTGLIIRSKFTRLDL